MGRAPCCEKNGLKKGPWSQEEDQKLVDYIQKYGYGNWRTLPTNAGLQRCGKSCRLRWTNYLRPDIKRGKFSFEEEETIIHLHSILGNKWSLIAARLPGRTDNEIKNYWNTNIRKRLLRMGIDPVTHSPRLQLLDLSTILNTSLCNNSPSQVINFSRLLGLEPRINPELLRFATSLQNHIPSQFMQTSAQYTTTLPDLCDHDGTTLGAASFLVHDEAEEFQQNVAGFGIPSTLTTGDYVSAIGDGYYGSGQPLVDPSPSSEVSNIQSNCSNSTSFGFPSILSSISTPSSSPTPLTTSNSTYVNSVSSTEDERESYYSSMMKFEITDFLDVNDFV